MTFGGTNEVASKWRTPAAASLLNPLELLLGGQDGLDHLDAVAGTDLAHLRLFTHARSSFTGL